MRNLFTVQEMLHGVPDLTLLNLVYRGLGSDISIYPGYTTLSAKWRRECSSGNRFACLHPALSKGKTCPLPQLLDDINLHVPLQVLQDSQADTLQEAVDLIKKHPRFNTDTDNLALHWILQYARTHHIFLETFVNNMEKAQTYPAHPSLQHLGNNIVVQLCAHWEKYTLLPTLHYELSLPNPSNPKKTEPFFRVPATVKVETTSTGPSTGTILLGYSNNCQVSSLTMQDDIRAWLKAILHGQPIYYNNTQSSPLSIAVPVV